MGGFNYLHSSGHLNLKSNVFVVLYFCDLTVFSVHYGTLISSNAGEFPQMSVFFCNFMLISVN